MTIQTQIDELNDAALLIAETNPKLAIEKAQSAKKLAQSADSVGMEYAAGLANSEIVLSLAYFALSQYEAALKSARSAEFWAQQTNDTAILVIAVGCVGGAYVRLSNYAKGMTYFNEQLRLAEKTNNLSEQASAYNGLTIICGETGRYHEAIEHAAASLTIREKLGDKIKMIPEYGNLCRAHAHVKQFEKALDFGQSGLQLAQVHQPQYLGGLYSNIGFCYKEMGEYDKAIDYYEKIRSTQDIHENTYYDAISAIEIAQINLSRHQLTSALEQAQHALKSAKKSKNQWVLFQAHKLLSKIFEQQEDYKTALFHHQQFQQIQNAAIGEKNAEQMRYLQISFEVDEAQREAELYRIRTEELESVVQERTADLQSALEREMIMAKNLAAALEQAHATNKLRSNIITTISHEFRTPLTVINTSADILDHHAAKLSAEKRSAIHARITNSIDYLTHLLQNMALVESTHEQEIVVKRSETRFAELCQTVIDACHTMLNAPANVQYVYDAHCTTLVSADFDLLRQIVLSLLKNALTFSAADAPIINEFAIEDSWLTVTITDNGIGIPTEEIEPIFNLFYRGSNIEQRRGLGAGLYTTKSIVAAQGGTIKAASAGNGLGATFTVRLPLSI